VTDIIFARTRHDYYHPVNGSGSYYDYWRMVELNGYSTCYTDEIDASDASKCYIFTPRNGEHEAGWPDAKARIIHWNLERHGYDPLPGVSETWCSDKALADKTGARYVLMGSDERLRTEFGQLSDTKDIDLALFMYMTHRRERIHNMLKERGITMARGGWYDERHDQLAHSRAMLVIHQDDEMPWLAPQRFCIAAAYKLPVICETPRDRGDLRQSDVLISDYHHLAEFAQMWLKPVNAADLERFGWHLYRHLCHDWTFKMCVEANV
jgi:hypothetical protein